MILFSNLYKRFSYHDILSDISGKVKTHDKIGIIGPNGAGKSTLLLLLANIYKQNKGRIQYTIKKHDMYCITHESMLYEDLTVWDHLYFLTTIHSKKSNENIYSILKRVNLHDKKDNKVSQLSFGMKKRLQIARFLLSQPKMLFLDEPFWGLDIQGLQLLHRTLQNQATFILVDHEIQHLWEHCNIFWILQHGKIQEKIHKANIALNTLIQKRDQYS